MSFLELNNVEKYFGQIPAVAAFDLKVNSGEFVAFLGPSGCGKTTTLRMIAGFERPTSGHIIINDVDVTNLPANRRNIGMVFQSYALFPNMTAAGNINFGLKVGHQPADTMRRRVTEMLELIRMSDFANYYPHQLSGGQQQRVALARALAIRPQVLLLDEPLSALDAKIRLSLRQEIRSIQRQLSITTIFVTHDQEEALSISDRIVVMNQGKIEQIGTPLDIYNSPQTRFVASFVGTLNVLNAQVIDRANRRIAVDGQELSVVQTLPDPTERQVGIAIRPEAIHLHNSAGAGINSINGTVNDIYFLGSVVRIRVMLHDQFINADVFNNPNLELPERGQPVKLSFPPEACTVLRTELR